MKNLLIILILIILSSCDPNICTEEVIKNNTDSDLSINFITKDTLLAINDRIILNNKSSSFRGGEECALGGIVLNYSIYDSIYLTDTSNKILKVFKEDTPNKNIYNIDEFWMVEETSKNHFVYTYEITEEDLE